jgi:hypothetical protein
LNVGPLCGGRTPAPLSPTFQRSQDSALLLAVVAFCVPAQVGSDDYVEWKLNDGTGPPQRPDDWAQWNDAQWAEWTRKYESWDRKRWSVHVRANPDAIFAFGRQPFFGYPANSFGFICLTGSLALVFENGSVRGAGVDLLGDFEIAGTYDVANGSCEFKKRYACDRAVGYRGNHVDQAPHFGFSGDWCCGGWCERFLIEPEAR